MLGFMRYQIKKTYSAAALALLLASTMALTTAQAQQQTVKHAQGETQLAAKPATTVVFDLPSLDALHALGVPVAAVPATPLPDYLAEYTDKAYPKVGTLFEPNYEAVHALSPDLVIVGGRSAPKQRDLSRIAPTIDLTPDPTALVRSVIDNTQTLAGIFEKQDDAQRLTKELETAIEALRAKAADAGSALIVLTVGGKMSAYGPGSRFGVIHDSFGIAPAVPNLATSNHGQAISFEFIHKHDPDWVFVIDRDAAIGTDGTPARQLMDNALMHKTSAWKNDRIVYLDSMNWYLLGSAGISAMQKNVTEISQALDER